MRRSILVCALIARLSADSVQDIQIGNISGDGFNLSWNWEGEQEVLDFQIETVDGDGNVISTDVVEGTNFNFSGLDEASLYTVRIDAIVNGTASGNIATYQASTSGNGIYVDYDWHTGAVGQVFWPPSSVCGQKYSFSVDCDNVVFSMPMVPVTASGNAENGTDFTFQLSGKTLHDQKFQSFYASSNNCDWSSNSVLTLSDAGTGSSNFAAVTDFGDNSWSNGGRRSHQLTFGVSDEAMYFCTPSFDISTSCTGDLSVDHTWGLEIPEDGFEGFVAANTTIFNAVGRSVYERSIGFEYSYADGDCENAEHQITINFTQA